MLKTNRNDFATGDSISNIRISDVYSFALRKFSITFLQKYREHVKFP